jgi:choline dehydrogenase-like flavoprotein
LRNGRSPRDPEHDGALIREAKHVAPGSAVIADVVVVGAGPLGIVTALELADRGHTVALIESGGQAHDQTAQDLTRWADRDAYHVASDLAVRRQLGGTTTLWGGRCVPFDPIDFESRSAQPDALWPIPYGEMAQHLPRACDWCVCGDATFNVSQLPELAGKQMIPGFEDAEVRTTDLERWSLPTRFGSVYRRRLQRERRVDLITGLTCTKIVCDEATGRVDHIELKAPGGLEVTARGRRYVLAAGGIETTRLLMTSNDVHRDGIGNQGGHLGRWYMAHVEARVANVQLTTPAHMTIHDHERDHDGVYVRRRFTFSSEVQRRLGLSNAAIWFVNPKMAEPAHGSGILSGVYLTLISPVGRFMLAEAIRAAHTKSDSPVQARAHLRNIVSDLGGSARFAASFGYRRFLKPGRKAPGFFVRSEQNVYPVDYQAEHLPNRESRLLLSSERDSLGMLRVQTALKFSDADIHNVGRAMTVLDESLRRARVGYVRLLHKDPAEGVIECLQEASGFHQTGTTRMAATAAQGVVDSNLAVFGADNLFVASTSVLPTSSQANPTLTGVAFTVRLVEHLHRSLA